MIYKEDIEYNDKIEELLEISNKDKDVLSKENILYIDIENKDDYEE